MQVSIQVCNYISVRQKRLVVTLLCLAKNYVESKALKAALNLSSGQFLFLLIFDACSIRQYRVFLCLELRLNKKVGYISGTEYKYCWQFETQMIQNSSNVLMKWSFLTQIPLQLNRPLSQSAVSYTVVCTESIVLDTDMQVASFALG